MKKTKRIITLFTMMIMLVAFPLNAFAHSGRTDSNGGHRDNKNKSGLGYYHYHCGGYPAHLHEDGVCPYDSSSKTNNKSNSNSSNKNNSTPKDKITITDYDTTMYIGEDQSFSYEIESESSSPNVQVSSSNDDVITVNGITLTARGAGTATITVETNTAKKTFTVTVKEIYADSLEIFVEQNELLLGTSMYIRSEISPSNTTNKKITYTSSDTSIATVSESGEIQAISKGEVTIKATTANNLSKEIIINVIEIYPESIKCEDKIDLIVGDTHSLQIDILPENAQNKNFSITSNGQGILEISNQSIKALKEGNAIIHIETWNGISKDIPVQIDIIPVEKIEISNETELVYGNFINKKSEIILKTKVVPFDATYKDVLWSSSDENIVSVKDNKFSIHGTGKVVLTATTSGNVSESVELFIIDKEKVIIISCISLLLVVIGGAVFIKKRNDKSKNNKKVSEIV